VLRSAPAANPLVFYFMGAILARDRREQQPPRQPPSGRPAAGWPPIIVSHNRLKGVPALEARP